MRAKTFLASLTTTLIVAAIASLWAVASPTSASCASALESDPITAAPAQSSAFVDALNQFRASKGLGALTVDSNLSGIAQDWAQHMAEAGAISHRVNLADGVTIDWKMLGENVGVGPTVSDLMTAFINSPEHYANIVNPTFTRIGVGTVLAPNGALYTAHEFASVRTAAPAPTPKPAPVVTAPAKVVPQQTAAVHTVTTAAPATTNTTVTTVTTVVTAPVAVHQAAAPTHVAGVATNAPAQAAKAHHAC